MKTSQFKFDAGTFYNHLANILHMNQMKSSFNLIENCPVLTPTMEEFASFQSYVRSIEDQYSRSYGIVKIIPPKQWAPRLTPYSDSLSNLIIKNPIQQNAEGKGGVYEFKHISLPEIQYQQYVENNRINDSITHNKTPDQIQSIFWRSLVYSSPVYGADLVGTLMDETAGSWNLNNLDSLLQLAFGRKLRGVNSSYCYIGSWKSLFCWHKEDLDLSAINFLHTGSSKFWYCIQASDSWKLQKQCRKNFYQGFEKCHEYLRHKTCLLNPYQLKKLYPDLKVSKVEQKAGEFIIAFGGAYHCGFNFGLNIAEAVNYATVNWLAKLKNVSYCTCRKSTVKASPSEIVKQLQNYQSIKNHPQFLSLKKEIEQKECELGTVVNSESNQIEGLAKKQKKISKSGKHGKKQAKKKKEEREFVSGQEQSQTLKIEIVTELQCDQCNSWQVVSLDQKAQFQASKFFCFNIGKHCQAGKEI